MLLVLFFIYIVGIVPTFFWIICIPYDQSKGITLCLVWPLVLLKMLIKDIWEYFRHW